MKPNDKNYFYFTNRSYYISCLLSERLEELNEPNITPKLKTLLDEAITGLKLQAKKVLEVILQLGKTDSQELANSSIDFLESKFANIMQPGLGFQLVYLYDYLFLADCMMAETQRLSVFLHAQRSGYDSQDINLYEIEILRPTLEYLKEQFLLTLTV